MPTAASSCLPGRAAAALHAQRHALELRDGSALGYDRLLIATGAEPRRLPLFDDAPNAHVLRTAADAGSLRAALRPGARLLVVGAGFIGQEVAATARGLGVAVTLLEAMDAPLAGLLGHELGTWFADLHRSEGVDVRCGSTAVDARRDDRGRITEVVTGDGRSVACDLVLVGVGVAPADAWLAGSGLGGGGVECDEAGRTALPDVYRRGRRRPAVRPLPRHACAAASTGRPPPGRGPRRLAPCSASSRVAAPLSSFWSDQYGLRIQYVGYASLGDTVELDGDPSGATSPPSGDATGRPVAALLVGRPRELPRTRQLIQETLEHRGDNDMTYIPQIDGGACAAHGDCEAVAPDVFRVDDVATVIGTGDDELILRAAESCPAVAITVVDSETGATVYP